MQLLAPEGLEKRKPGAKKVHKGVIVVLGPDHEWSGDGHDKLVKIGFPIWALRDVWSGWWIGIWLVPNNRRKKAIAYLWLLAVKERGGIPIQTTTDCGSETIDVFGCANVLRDLFAPQLDKSELPAHKFLKSINNITIERGWLQLRLKWGDNVLQFWRQGEHLYNPTDRQQFMLARWLWSDVIREELQVLQDHMNSHRGVPGLQPVDTALITEMMEELGGEDIVRFVPRSYEEKAAAALASLNITEVTLQNVWTVFCTMLPSMPTVEEDEYEFATSA
ncbi:hypothetical protein FS837_003936 [Tulasnella sp. UAMH 9824]|nr:hypothetical protein FS837_003936 [Tulasnella sp. UAMH 9824]